MNNYPSVLIIGQTFDKSGGGITLANLFLGWPKDKIAVASMEVDTNDKSVCTKNYVLGYLETKKPWPLSLLQRKWYSGPMDVEDKKFTQHLLMQSKENEFRRFVRVKYLSAQHSLGIFHYIHRMAPSEKFISWVNDFKPDLIYTQLSSLGLIRTVKSLNEMTGIPMAIHIMDDWPATIVKPGLLSSYWKKVIDREFRELIDRSVALMSICQAMSDEYEKRYGRKWLSFHNPIDMTMWKGKSRCSWEVNNPIRIMYAGRLGDVNLSALSDICEAVSDLRSEGHSIVIDVRTPDRYNHQTKIFEKYSFVEVNPYIRHEEMPQKLRSMDLLIIPLDFTAENIKFTQFSMPGKTSDYMASGTPILVYAPPQNALVTYAKDGGWGYVVGERDTQELKKAIKALVSDESLRERLGRKAIELAFKNHDATVVRHEFQNYLMNSAKMNA